MDCHPIYLKYYSDYLFILFNLIRVFISILLLLYYHFIILRKLLLQMDYLHLWLKDSFLLFIHFILLLPFCNQFINFRSIYLFIKVLDPYLFALIQMDFNLIFQEYHLFLFYYYHWFFLIQINFIISLVQLIYLIALIFQQRKNLQLLMVIKSMRDFFVSLNFAHRIFSINFLIDYYLRNLEIGYPLIYLFFYQQILLIDDPVTQKYFTKDLLRIFQRDYHLRFIQFQIQDINQLNFSLSLPLLPLYLSLHFLYFQLFFPFINFLLSFRNFNLIH